MKKALFGTPILLLLLPMVARAQSFCPQSGAQLENIGEFFNLITCILLRSLVPLLFAAALVLFLYGVLRFVLAAKEGKKGTEREEGKKFMIWGIVALFVMISVWGLVSLLSNTLNFNNGGIPQLKVDQPSVNQGGGSGCTGPGC